MIMPKPHTNAFPPGRLLAGLLIGAAGANAQDDVFAPPAQNPVPAQQQFGVRMVPDPSLVFAPAPDSPYQWGDFVLKPHLLYRFLYGDGVQASPGHQSTTAINSFSPGFLLDMGSQWNVDYTPTWDLYSNRNFHDTIGEAVRLAGTIPFADSLLNFTQGYNYSSQPLIETGRQTSVEDFSTALDVSHRLNQQFFFQTVVDQNFQYAVGFPSSKQWSAQDSLHYQPVPQLDTSLGAGLGFIDLSGGSDVFFFDPDAQATWAPTSKLSFNVSGGLDRREFLVHPRSILDTPIYSVAVQYNPFEWTGLGLSAGRQVGESLFVNQSSKDTSLRASLSQRLLEHYFLTASVAQTNADYLVNTTASSAGRNDKILSYNLRLTWSFLQRGTLSILYQWNRNDSTASAFGFSSHQAGLELGYRY